MKYQELLKEAKALAQEAVTLAENGDVPGSDAKRKEAEAKQQQAEAIKSASTIVSSINEPVLPAPLPTTPDNNQPIVDAAGNAVKAFYLTRFGDEGDAIKAVMVDLHGSEYQQKLWEQQVGFAKYLRGYAPAGREFLWTPKTVKLALDEGQDVQAMKTVMIEARNDLGGAFVPEDWRAEVISRMASIPGLRARARVTQTSRDRVEYPKMTGGDSQYRDAVRVTWVQETPTAGTAATNLTVGSEPVPIYTVMAETFLSLNLVEDSAFNIVSWLAQSFASAQAVDENTQFLVGDGNGKPEGILKDSGLGALGSSNYVASGNASALTADGVIGLVYGIDAQYRRNAVLIGEKATMLAVRKLKAGTGEYLWQPNYQGSQPDRLLGYEVLEEESMPTITNDTYPLLFGDPQGYLIADRVGMTVERLYDSATARIGQVCYVARRRLGGKLVEPWRFTAQKVATS